MYATDAPEFGAACDGDGDRQGRCPRRGGRQAPEDMQRFAPEFTPDFVALLNPAEGMKSREIPGGTGSAAVAGALARARQLLGKLIV